MNPSRDALDRVDVLIVNYNAGEWLARAVDSVRPDGADRPAIRIVDNGSTDGSAETVDPQRAALDRTGRNLGFAVGINRAAGQATAEFLLLLNPDCLIRPDALAILVDELDRHPEAALVSGRILDLDGREQRGSRRRLPTPSRVLAELMRGDGVDLTDTPPPDGSIEVEAVSGACMLVRRSAFEQVGGLDAAYPMHFEDLDLFARLAGTGWSLRWVPDAEIVHAGGRSSAHRPVRVLWAKHRGLWIYLQRHCLAALPRWQRPIWRTGLAASALMRTPMVWASARWKRR